MLIVTAKVPRRKLAFGAALAALACCCALVLNLTNAMGEMVIACNVIIMRVDGFAMMPNFSFGQAMSVYTGQNVGAGKYDRMHAGAKQGSLIAVAFSSVITVILLFFSQYLFAFFTRTPELIDLAVRMIRIMAVGYICMAITQCLGGVMRGAGDTVSPMWISIATTFVIRVPVAYLLAWLTRSEVYPHGSPVALFGSLMISWILGMVMSIIVYALGKWKKNLPV